MNERRDSSGSQSRTPHLEVTSLGSGSSGNAILVRTADGTVLVDCGVGIRRMTKALTAGGLRLPDINAVLVTHEHSDHVRELGRFSANTTAILCTRGTALAAGANGDRHADLRPLRPMPVAGIEVIAIPVSHDAQDPCGFLLRTPTGSVTVLTDLGCASAAAAEAIAESHLVVLEANHDESLLRRGPYPAHLQRRILSDTGHLSNAASADLLATSLQGSRSLPTVWLAHLSATNNRPHLAVQTVRRRLARAGLQLDVRALPRQEISETWTPASGVRGLAQLMLEFPDPAAGPGGESLV